MHYYAARRNDNRIVMVGSSPNLPDVETYLTNATAYGGTLDDYQLIELSEAIYTALENNLHRLPYYDGQTVTYPEEIVDIRALAGKQKANFKRGFITRKQFSTILDRKVTAVWQTI